MIGFFSLIILLGYVFSCTTPEKMETHVVAPNGETRICDSIGSDQIVVNITTHEVPIGTPAAPIYGAQSGCTYSRYPCNILDKLTIRVNNKLLFVPRSAFCDFVDLASLAIQKDDSNEFVLMVRGGDASESYIGRILFDHSRIINRDLSSAMTPDDLREKTIYFIPRDSLDE
jgi:hypothetical protein